jgi:hypothetical protein
MRIQLCRLTSQSSTATVPADSGSVVLVPFTKCGHRLAKTAHAPLTSEWSAAKAAIRPPQVATGETATGWSTASGVIIDFARARKSGRAPRIREESSSENRKGITLADLAVIIYVTMAMAFYPALAWLLIPS